MPSGKQLSFELGEISPALRFKTDQATYARALSELSDGVVRKTGGVSNRPGARLVTTPAFQSGIGTEDRFRLFGTRFSVGEGHLLMMPSGSLESVVWRDILSGTENASSISGGFDLKNVKTTRVDDTFILSNGTRHVAYDYNPAGPAVTPGALDAPTKYSAAAAATYVTGFVGGVWLEMPVAYRLYEVHKDGSEVLAYPVPEVHVYAPGAPGTPVQPTGVLFMVVNFTGLSNSSKIKHYNVYRASLDATALTHSNWGLVGRFAPPIAPATTHTFNDYISSQDITQPPPDEDYLYGNYIGTKTLLFNSSRLIGHYQQRRVVIINPDGSELEEGQIAVSKVGTPNMMDTQKIFTAAGAFNFTLPESVQGRIVAMLEMERLALFTEDAAVIIQGGENAALTPSQINPKVVDDEGCSPNVTPQALGKRGFYLSKTEDKLNMLEFGLNNELAIEDLSKYSDHLFETGRFRQMVVTKGPVKTVWLLRDDGVLVSAAVRTDREGNVAGWSVHETDGQVESIAALTMPRENPISDADAERVHESLFMSVIRDGVRYVERLVLREDRNDRKEQWAYADAHVCFGSHLYYRNASDVYNQYDRTVFPSAALSYERLNLTTAGGWTPDDEITVTALEGTPFTSGAGGTLARRIDFYYDEPADGEGGTEEVITKMIRFRPTTYVSTTVVRGYFEYDVPAQLQDLETLAPSDKEKKQSRFLFADNSISGLTHLASKDVTVYADGEVLSSPLNPNRDDTKLTVSAGGVLTLPDYYSWGVVGLPYDFDMETLDLDTADERTFTDANKLINQAGIALHETQGGFVGGSNSKDDFGLLTEIAPREDEVAELLNKNINGHIVQDIEAAWDKNGRVHIKQVDPLPITVLAVYPKGIVGD